MKKHTNWRHRRVQLDDEQVQAQLLQTYHKIDEVFKAKREIAHSHRRDFLTEYENLCSRYGCSKYLCFTQSGMVLECKK